MMVKHGGLGRVKLKPTDHFSCERMGLLQLMKDLKYTINIKEVR